ncbi:helix-turn-helix domain-containing protein [Chitinophaga sp. CF418]|uniref:helix-turn-helix domain-containing protein n=1 Tax=Chitinophaga sp. CF418 TaxID=1855287 RepID=UPI00090F6DBA|nr:Helix-turn-helix domain-containing protein [Chitinophaga sp. CF418]
MQSKPEILKLFGSRLKKIREEKGLTQMDVAFHLSTGTGYISRLENGRTEPGITMLYVLAEVLECNPKDLL